MYVQRIHAHGISGLCSRSHSNKNRRDTSCVSTSIAITAYNSPIVSSFFWDKQNIITESDFPPSPVILSRQYCETQLPSPQKSLPTPHVRPGPACFVASETIWSSGGIQHPGVCCLDSAGVFKVYPAGDVLRKYGTPLCKRLSCLYQQDSKNLLPEE